MIEPTESESLAELDNFVHVMLAIWQEIQEVKNGEADKNDNVLVNAPHPEYEVVADTWEHSYTRQKAAYPIESVRDNKFWVNVARVDNTLATANCCLRATGASNRVVKYTRCFFRHGLHGISRIYLIFLFCEICVIRESVKPVKSV